MKVPYIVVAMLLVSGAVVLGVAMASAENGHTLIGAAFALFSEALAFTAGLLVAYNGR